MEERLSPLLAAYSYQRGHVSSVHLATGDLLLGRWHAAHLEILRPRGSGAHDSGQGHRAVLHLPHPVILLLQHCRPRRGHPGKHSEDSVLLPPSHPTLLPLQVLESSGAGEVLGEPVTG